MIAKQLKQVYGEGFLLENELIDGCYQLLASHAALAERLKALESAWLECEGIHAKGLEPTIKGVEALITERDTLAERMKEAEVTVGWFCDLVKRASIGTPETPSLRAYVEQLEERLKACEAERDALAEAFGVGGERESLSQLIAERDALKAENTRLRELLNEILEHDGSRRVFHAFKLYEARRKAEVILMAAAKGKP